MYLMRDLYGPEAEYRLRMALPLSLGLPMVVPHPEVFAQVHSPGQFKGGQRINNIPGNMARSTGIPGQDRAGQVAQGADGRAVSVRKPQRQTSQTYSDTTGSGL